MKKFYLEIKKGKENRITGYMLDLSRGGMAIASRRMFDKDELVEIKTKNDPSTVLKAKVVSAVKRQDKTYGYRLGVRFIKVIKNEKLNEFIYGAENRKAIRLNLL